MAFMPQEVIRDLEASRSLDSLKRVKKENLANATINFGITPAAGATKSNSLDLRNIALNIVMKIRICA